MAFFELSTLPSFLLSRIISIILAICLSSLHLYIHQRLVPIPKLSFHLKSILHEREYWRLISSQFVHASLLHIGFNIFALLSYSFLESTEGTIAFIRLNFLLLVFCPLLQMLIYYVLWKVYRVERYYEMHAVGYSCVIFGLMTYASMKNPLDFIYLMGFLPMPSLMMPFVSLFITQIIVPRASLLGHLTGILVAYPLSVPAAVEWMNPWWLFTSIAFMCAALIVNLKWTNPDLRLLKWIDVQLIGSDDADNSIAALTVVNGVLVSQASASHTDDSEDGNDSDFGAHQESHRIDIHQDAAGQDSQQQSPVQEERTMVDLPSRGPEDSNDNDDSFNYNDQTSLLRPNRSESNEDLFDSSSL